MGISKEPFIEGEVYRCKRAKAYHYLSEYIFVVGIAEDTSEGILLAIFWVEKDTMNILEPGDIFITKKEYDKWERIEL